MDNKNIYSCIEQEDGPGPSIEGYIIFVSGVHEEAQEDQIHDLFSEYGAVKNMHVNLDRKTGYLKGYTLIEYELMSEAQKAYKALNGSKFMGKQLAVDFAFKKPPEVEQRK